MHKIKPLLVLIVSLSVVACTNPGKKTAIGAGTGAVLGAGLGAIIGSATGDAGRGVAIGAGMGALAGGAVGNEMDAGDQEIEAQRNEIDRQQALIDENRRLIEELRARGADVRSDERGVIINLPDVLFEFDSSRLTRDAQNTVEEIGSVLRDVKGRRIAVEGHTDSIGSFEYNQRLSRRRAESVAQELESNGISERQLSVTGYGEGKPIATNNTEYGRARNRRVEVIVEN